MNQPEFWPVLVTAIISMAIGAFWYSPLGFGKVWTTLMGFSDEAMQKAKEKGMGKTYLASFIGTLVMTYVLGIFVVALERVTFTQGAQLGFWIWLGFVATTFLNSVLWEGKPLKLYAINISHYLAVLLVAGGILAALA